MTGGPAGQLSASTQPLELGTRNSYASCFMLHSARPAALGRLALAGLARDQFVQDGLARLGPQDAPQALDVLARHRRAAGDDGDVGVRHVDALVEDAPRH